MRKPSAAFVLAVLLAVSWIGFLASSPFAQQIGGPAPAQKWEYSADAYSLTAHVEKLNQKGAEGWEVVAVRPHPNNDQFTYVLFKRPRQ